MEEQDAAMIAIFASNDKIQDPGEPAVCNYSGQVPLYVCHLCAAPTGLSSVVPREVLGPSYPA